MDFKKDLIKEKISSKKADAVLIFSEENRRWYSNFESSFGFIIATNKESVLFLDGRYITKARNSKELSRINKIVEMKNYIEDLNKYISKNNISNLVFESDKITYSQFINWEKYLNAKLIPSSFEKIRMIKEDTEIENIRKACEITDKVFKDVLNFAKVGITENELSRFVSDSFLKYGADKLSFDTIVASGKNGCMPHAGASDKQLAKNELITLDMGCFYNGYASDQTRTFAIGDVSEKLKEIYNIVYEAQELGIKALKPGVKCSDIHKICFDYIDSKGYGEYFTHGTGHGIGLEIHEEPYNYSSGNEILIPGMCVTVEPGIYIPDVGGVRIEDDLLITDNGHNFLTISDRKLIVL